MPTDPNQPIYKHYVLSEEDRAKFKMLWEEYKRLNPDASPRRDRTAFPEHEEQQAADFYVAKPIDTITARSGDTTGHGMCTVYQAVSVTGEVEDTELLEVVGFDLEILNKGDDEFTNTDWVFVAKDKYGRWWVVTSGGGDDPTFLAVLTEIFYAGDDIPVYSWARVMDTPPFGYAEVCPYERGCAMHTPAYHERNLALPVVGVVQNSTGTGTAGDDPNCESIDSILCPAPLFIHPKSVVRMRRYGPMDEDITGTGTGTGTGTAEGGYCLFSGHHWVDLFRRTGINDAHGEIGFRRRYNQDTQEWEDGEEVRIIEPE